MAKKQKPQVVKASQFTSGWSKAEAKTSPAVVLVHWVDACVNGDVCLEPFPGWEKSWRSGVLMQTTGFLLRKTQHWVTIGMERHAERDGGFRRVQDIPMYAVVNLEVLKPPKNE